MLDPVGLSSDRPNQALSLALADIAQLVPMHESEISKECSVDLICLQVDYLLRAIGAHGVKDVGERQLLGLEAVSEERLVPQVDQEGVVSVWCEAEREEQEQVLVAPIPIVVKDLLTSLHSSPVLVHIDKRGIFAGLIFFLQPCKVFLGFGCERLQIMRRVFSPLELIQRHGRLALFLRCFEVQALQLLKFDQVSQAFLLEHLLFD